MEEKLARTRNFFKIMMPGFQEKLNLPPAFCNKIRDKKSERATLKSRKGTWMITVFRDYEGGLICFKDGWPQFVHHHCLSIGDLVLFQHTRKLDFNVSIFDSTACEKEFLDQHRQEATEAATKNTKRESGKELVASYHSKSPYFVSTMKPHHACQGKFTIPAKFVRSNNLLDISRVTLKDPSGRAWPVKLIVERTNQLQVRIVRGWHDFYLSNEIKDGDVCVFHLNRSSLRSTSIILDVQLFPAPSQEKNDCRPEG